MRDYSEKRIGEVFLHQCDLHKNEVLQAGFVFARPWQRIL